MQRSIAEVIGNVIFHSPSGNPSALTLCSNGTNTSPRRQAKPERFAMKIIPMLLAALLATGAATAQAQDGANAPGSTTPNSAPRERTARKRLQKQQLEAQAQTNRSKCAERKNATAEQPFTEQYTCPFGLLLWTSPEAPVMAPAVAPGGRRRHGRQRPPPSRFPPYSCNARGRWLRRSAAGAGLAWSWKSKSSSAKRPPSTPRSRAAAGSSLKRRSPISPSRVA